MGIFRNLCCRWTCGSKKQACSLAYKLLLWPWLKPFENHSNRNFPLSLWLFFNPLFSAFMLTLSYLAEQRSRDWLSQIRLMSMPTLWFRQTQISPWLPSVWPQDLSAKRVNQGAEGLSILLPSISDRKFVKTSADLVKHLAQLHQVQLTSQSWQVS